MSNDALNKALAAAKAKKQGKLAEFVKAATTATTPTAAPEPPSVGLAAPAEALQPRAAAPAPKPSPFDALVVLKEPQDEDRHPGFEPDFEAGIGPAQSAWPTGPGATPTSRTSPLDQPTQPGKLNRASAAFAELAKQSNARREAADEADRQRATQGASGGKQAPAQPDPPWGDADIPAGSAYSSQEWERAREQMPKDHCLFEMRNAGECALVMVPHEPAARMVKQVVQGKLQEVARKDPSQQSTHVDQLLPQMIADMIDGCLLLAPSAMTSHPGAVSGTIRVELRDAFFGQQSLRVVRPQSHRETKPWYFGFKASVGFPEAHAEQRDHERDLAQERDKG